MCRILNVSRSGYYQWCKRGESPRKKQDQKLKEKSLAIFLKYKKNGMAAPGFMLITRYGHPV
jgi:hypothetical protein